MSPAQRLDAALATATAKLSRWHVAQAETGVLSSRLSLTDGRTVEVHSTSVDAALVRVLHTDGELKNYTFNMASHEPLILETTHIQDPQQMLGRQVVEADALGIARVQEFDQLLLDCVDELPLLEDV